MTVKFSKEHEWIRMEDAGAVVGITEYAQEQLGDVVYVELPEVGREAAKDDEVAVVESVKAASEIYTPVSGTVTEVNEALDENPAAINADPLGDGWIFKLKVANASELDSLMDEAGYQEYISSLD